MIGTTQPLIQLVDINHRWPNLPQQDNVVAAAGDVIAPYGSVGKDLHERGDLTLHRFEVTLVERNPLSVDASGIQVLLAEFVILG